MRSSLRLALAALGVLALAVTASCSSDPRHDAPIAQGTSDVATEAPEADVPGPHVKPPVDLQSVVRHAAFAFRGVASERGAFASGGATFEAKVVGSAIHVTPRRGDALLAARGSTLSLETSLVTRGSHVLAGATLPATTHLENDGAVAVRRGEVTERIESDDAGVEQSWRFERAPSGKGDLAVHVRTGGERYASRTDHGLHFASRGGAGPGLRYGTATWVDAGGRRTTITPRFDVASGEIVMTVPDRVLATSTYPAVLDPTLTPEQETDLPIAGSSAGGDQNSPSVISQGPGKGYFAVWYDRRGIRPAIYGARVATDGKVLDGTGIPIATSVGSNQPFIASANGGGYVVVWAVSYVDIYQQPGVYAVRLDADGNVLDQTPVTIVANQTNVQSPTAAFDGTNWMLAWNRYAGGPSSYDIFGARLGKTGGVVDATPIEISKELDAEFLPVVTFDGTDYFITWRSYVGVYGRKYGKDGKPLGAKLTLATSPSSSLYNFHATFDGTRHVIVWSTYEVNGPDIYARRFDKNGAPIDPGYIPIAVDANYDDRPRIAYDGTDFLITWSRSGVLTGARMNVNGGVIDAPISLASGTGSYYDYALASDGLGSLVVDGEYTNPVGYDVMAVKIAKTPAANVAPVVLSKAANSETEPSLAWNGSNHFAAWVDSRGGQPEIWGALVGTDAHAKPVTKLVSNPQLLQLTRPRVASDGAGYLVVFYAYDQTTGRPAIHAQRVDATGAASGGLFDLTPANPNIFEYGEPDVAFDGTNYLVVWQQRSDGRSIAGVRLPKAASAPIDKEPLRISTINIDEQRTSPAIAFDGTSYYVTWIVSRSTASNIQVSHVYGTRVSKEGSALDGETVLCDAFLLQRAPRVAADPKRGGFFVVWEDFRTALEAADIYGARISPTGQSLDGTSGMKIATGMHDESRPHVAYAGDDSNWVVAWRDLRSKQTYDLYGAWVSLAGKNHDPNGFLLSAEGGDEEAPSLSTFAPGQLVLAYERLDPRTGYGSYRLRARAIDSGAKVATACTKNEDCATRSCVDKVCCSTDCGGCGVCDATPGTCTPRAAGSEAATCPGYKCKGTVECPSKCESDEDCASNATCDPSTKACVSRIICADSETLKDLTGKQTSCAPYKCIADACRTQCGSVDDCAEGFVCDNGGRCVQAPGGDASGCSVNGTSSSSGLLGAGAVWILAALVARRRRASRRAA
ncbi:MAG: Flagellar hook-length control protein FliK [Labilithrix sp.]|nr:Flagellar hook-length control protein FliK [Labilithrix sp.]